MVAIGGLDAHQIGKRIAGRVPLRLMSYTRSFRYLRTHVLCEELPSGELEHDREQVYDALRSGRCYLARDSLAPGRGFAFWADGPGGELAMGAETAAGDWSVHVRTPRPARLRLVKDGETLAEANRAELDHPAEGPGVYRAEAHLDGRTWLLSNPVYLR